LTEGKSVVISLVGTEEARTKEQVAKATANGGMLEDLDFSIDVIDGLTEMTDNAGVIAPA
jgi:hypothetical protein